MVACTSHVPPDRAQAEDPPAPVVTLAPAGWAARVDAGGDFVLGLVALTDGGTAVLTHEYLDTSNDETYVLSRYDAAGQLSFSNRLGSSYRECRRCLAAAADGGVAVLDSENLRIEVHAADGRIELLDPPPAEPDTRGVLLRSHPHGGFLIGASSMWQPWMGHWDAAPRPSGWRMHTFFGRIVAGSQDEHGRSPASWTSLGHDRHHLTENEILVDLAIAADGTFAAVIACNGAVGGQSTDAVRCAGGGLVGQWDASGKLEWLRPIGSGDPETGENLEPVAIAPHPASGFALFGRRTRMEASVVHYGRDGASISTKSLPIGRGALRDAAIAGHTAWLAVVEPASGPRPSQRAVGSIVRVDLETGEHVSMPLRPRTPTHELRSGDVMTPTMIATDGDQVRVAGFYGWPTRVPLVDRPAVDLDLRDPNGRDDDVFLWAMTPGAAIDP